MMNLNDFSENLRLSTDIFLFSRVKKSPDVSHVPVGSLERL